jgi:hypothetical protein
MALKGTRNRDALIKWLQAQDNTITRATLTKKVGEIWGTAHASKITSYLLKENPKIFEDIKILSLSDVKGTTAFRKYLTETHKRSTTVPQLLADFKKATGKTVDANVGNIGTEFSSKFNLATSKDIPPNKIEQKAINAYKKLSQKQKFSFQMGGPSQKGVYAKWLTDQGLDSGNTGQTRFRKLLEREGLYEKAPIKTPAEIAKIQEARTSGIGKSGATTYEADLVKFKKGVLKDLKVPPMKLSGGGERVPLDQSHRLSYKQLKRLGEKYTGSNIGADWVRTNTSAARKLEVALDPFYDKQYNLWKKAKKLKTIPKSLTESLDKVNNQIAELVAEKSGGRIQGVQVDPYNLKVGNTPINYKYAADLGTTEGSLSKIKPKSLQDFMFKLNYGEQIKNEAIAAGLINKAPKNFKKLLEARVGCADGCLAVVAKNEPGKITKALTTLPDKAKSFFGLLGRGGAKAAPYAALAAVGAVAEPLVKQFVADDPNTYLTNENQQKGMLLSLLEREPPKVDEEILKWQYPGQIAGAAAAVPGSKAVMRARKIKGMGTARAALGPVGKVLAGSFSPLGVAASLPIGIAAQRAGGTDYGDIATDPLNWVGPAFASSGAEMASKGIKNPMLLRALRLGMSSRALMLGSRFLGLPGLALTAGMWGYDKWKGKVDKDEEFRLRRYRDDDDE